MKYITSLISLHYFFCIIETKNYKNFTPIKTLNISTNPNVVKYLILPLNIIIYIDVLPFKLKNGIIIISINVIIKIPIAIYKTTK